MVENNEINHSEIAETERLGNKEKGYVMEELGRIYDQLQNPEFLIQTAIERLEEEVVPMIEDLFEPEDSFEFEHIPRVGAPHPFGVDTISVWREMDEEERQEIINEIGNYFFDLDIDLGDPESALYKNAVKRKYEEEGVAGASSEGKVIVTVLATNNPAIDIHVSEYEDTTGLGKQYSLVRAKSD